VGFRFRPFIAGLLLAGLWFLWFLGPLLLRPGIDWRKQSVRLLVKAAADRFHPAGKRGEHSPFAGFQKLLPGLDEFAQAGMGECFTSALHEFTWPAVKPAGRGGRNAQYERQPHLVIAAQQVPGGQTASYPAVLFSSCSPVPTVLES